MAVMWVAAINLMARAITGTQSARQPRESTLVVDRRAACSSRAGSHHTLPAPAGEVWVMGYSTATVA
jgi:hypothetical protein